MSLGEISSVASSSICGFACLCDHVVSLQPELLFEYRSDGRGLESRKQPHLTHAPTGSSSLVSRSLDGARPSPPGMQPSSLAHSAEGRPAKWAGSASDYQHRATLVVGTARISACNAAKPFENVLPCSMQRANPGDTISKPKRGLHRAATQPNGAVGVVGVCARAIGCALDACSHLRSCARGRASPSLVRPRLIIFARGPEGSLRPAAFVMRLCTTQISRIASARSRTRRGRDPVPRLLIRRVLTSVGLLMPFAPRCSRGPGG